MKYVGTALSVLVGLGLSVIIFGTGGAATVIPACIKYLPYLAVISKKC